MIAFEISINGERVCVAGVQGSGMLTGIVSSMQRDPAACPPGADPEAFAAKNGLTLNVGGMAGTELVEWLTYRRLQLGDEVHFKLVEADACDPPKVRPIEEVAPT